MSGRRFTRSQQRRRPLTLTAPELHLDQMSLAERLSLLSDEERRTVITDDDLLRISFDADFWCRPSQLEAVNSDAWITAVVAGRGFGKNFATSYWVKKKAQAYPGTRIALVARTVADVRDTMIQGPSGILSVYGPDEAPEYVPSLRKIVWPNGSMAMTFSSIEPSQLRGPSFHYIAVDELASWRHVADDSGATSWDHVKIGARLGRKPQIFVATTPKRHKVIRDLFSLAREEPDRVKLVGGSTLENATLSEDYVRNLLEMYGGTALEAQEIFGKLVLVVEDALWRERDIRRLPPPATGMLKLVGVDPGIKTAGDATGIIVVAGTLEEDLMQRQMWVLEDFTDEENLGTSPERWAARAVQAAVKHGTPDHPAIVVAEKNQGGEMVRTVIKQSPGGEKVPVVLIHASVDKATRAEPILMAYRRHRAWHAEGVNLEMLEDEMTSWEKKSGWSPNRMDAMVHAAGPLLVDDKPLRQVGELRVETVDPNLIVVSSWRKQY